MILVLIFILQKLHKRLYNNQEIYRYSGRGFSFAGLDFFGSSSSTVSSSQACRTLQSHSCTAGH